MTSTRRFHACDLFHFNNVNLDKLTENYHMRFYMDYLARWPSLCVVSTGAGTDTGSAAGYIIGKAEGTGKRWHGHVTAVTVAPEYRRLGLARALMRYLETASEQVYQGYFVDLYVRASNTLAVDMYRKLGYIIWRQVIGYYGDAEDAFDMHKALPRDREKQSMEPCNPLRVQPSDIDDVP